MEPEDMVVQPYLTVVDCFLDPLHCIVYRDLAGVVHCWNNSHRYVCTNLVMKCVIVINLTVHLRSSTSDCPADPVS